MFLIVIKKLSILFISNTLDLRCIIEIVKSSQTCFFSLALRLSFIIPLDHFATLCCHSVCLILVLQCYFSVSRGGFRIVKTGGWSADIVPKVAEFAQFYNQKRGVTVPSPPPLDPPLVLLFLHLLSSPDPCSQHFSTFSVFSQNQN